MQAKRSADSPGRPGIKLIFELTNLCNFSCTHCIREEKGPKSFLPVSLIEKVLTEAEAYRGMNFVAFTGGEPTLHPHFADILRLVTEAGYPFGFVTNGWHFVSRTFAQLQPYRERCAHVTFSLDGAREETHDKLRRRAHSFRRVMQSVMVCRVHEIPVHLNMVVTRSNRSEIEAMAMLASRLRCEALFYGHCQPTPDAIAAGLVLTGAERREVEGEIAELQRALQLRILLAGDHYEESRFYQCPQLEMKELNVDYRGYLTACCTLSSYRGGTADTDVVADLGEVGLFEGHQRLVDRIARLNREKIGRLSTRDAAEKDNFICTHCLEHYGKSTRLDSVLALPVLQPTPR